VIVVRVLSLPPDHPKKIKVISYATLEEAYREYLGYKNFIREYEDVYWVWLKEKQKNGSFKTIATYPQVVL
jgi:hypothetical protein